MFVAEAINNKNLAIRVAQKNGKEKSEEDLFQEEEIRIFLIKISTNSLTKPPVVGGFVFLRSRDRMLDITMRFFKENFYICALVFLALCSAFVWYVVIEESRGLELTVAFLDIGQGDAIFIESPTGRQVLIDGGPDKKVLRELSKVMPFYDRSIDVVMSTHPDKDHIAGLPEVLNRYAVDYVFEPGIKSHNGVYDAFERASKLEKADKIFARRGEKIDLGGGALLSILSPDRDMEGTETNYASIVAKLSYGKTSFLFTGDAPKPIEEYLAYLDGEALDVDVLKVGHHGSRTSTSDIFLGLTSPTYGIISAGAYNRYGHPHKEVIDALERFGVKTLATYKKGAVVFKSDGENVKVVRGE